MAGISYGNYYLPDNLVAVQELLKEHTNLTDDKIEEFVELSHLDKIAIEMEKSEIDICIPLMDKLFSQSGVSPNEISHIIYMNVLESSNTNISVPYLIQKMYSMQECTVIMLDLGCGATLQAVEIANALIETESANKVIIISSILGFKERYIDVTVVGDGVGILLIGSKDDANKIVDTISVTNGSYSFNEYNGIKSEINRFNILYRGAKLISKLIMKNHLTMEDIKVIVPLSISHYTYSAFAEFLDIPVEKLYLKNIPKGGHLGDIDIIRNYVDMVNDLQLQKGDKIILFALNYRNRVTDLTYYATLLEVQ